MSIEFECSQCFKRYRVADQFAGKKARCKGCKNVMLVPAQSETGELDLAPPPLPPDDSADRFTDAPALANGPSLSVYSAGNLAAPTPAPARMNYGVTPKRVQTAGGGKTGGLGIAVIVLIVLGAGGFAVIRGVMKGTFSDSTIKTNLVGDWTGTDPLSLQSGLVFHFKKDGTFSCDMSKDGQHAVIQGRWSLDSKMITINVTRFEAQGEFGPTMGPRSYQIDECTSTTLIWQAKQGTQKFERQ